MPDGEHQHEHQQETALDHQQQASGGGLRYQQGMRDPDLARGGTPTPAAVPADLDGPDHRQRAEEYGGPAPDDEAALREHGYPKLGSGVQERLTQVEHGPYPGGTEQGTPGEAESERSDPPARR